MRTTVLAIVVGSSLAVHAGRGHTSSPRHDAGERSGQSRARTAWSVTSGIQHFADSVASYRGLPDAPRAFLAQVPAAWDETRALAGEPGKAIVIARRDGTTWYVGGLNGEETARSIGVPLAFLGAGARSMTFIRDGADDRTFDSTTRVVEAAETVMVPMRRHGGFVMRLAPK